MSVNLRLSRQHRKKGLRYQKILSKSTGYIKYLCWSIMFFLAFTLICSAFWGAIMLDWFTVYCTLVLGGVFVFGGLLNMVTLYHMICANYFLLRKRDPPEDISSSDKPKITGENIGIATMVVVQTVLMIEVLLVGGSGAIFYGLSKIIDIALTKH